MGAMLVAEGVSSITGLVGVINDLITVAGTVIQFGLTTFPINVGVAVGHFRGMLRADNDRVSTDGFAVAVAQRYLTLSVGPKEWQSAVLTYNALTFHQAVCIVNRSGHQRGRFRAGIAEHQTLVAGAEIELVIHRVIDALGNVLRLLVVSDEN